MSKIVQFWGGPGCGKTTAALELTAVLKKQHKRVAYVSEFATQLIRERRQKELKHQWFVSTTQYKWVMDAARHHDYVVTDSPHRIGAVYSIFNAYKHHGGVMSNIAIVTEELLMYLEKEMLDKHEVYDVIITGDRRPQTYNAAGRRNSLEDALIIDELIDQLSENLKGSVIQGLPADMEEFALGL